MTNLLNYEKHFFFSTNIVMGSLYLLPVKPIEINSLGTNEKRAISTSSLLQLVFTTPSSLCQKLWILIFLGAVNFILLLTTCHCSLHSYTVTLHIFQDVSHQKTCGIGDLV